MALYTVFDDKGRIISSGECPDRLFNKQAKENQYVIGGLTDNRKQYVLRPDNVVVNKPSMEIMVDKIKVIEDEEVKITNIPVGAEVRIDGGQKVVINDGELILTFDTVGLYRIQFRLFPYMDWEGVILCE